MGQERQLWWVQLHKVYYSILISDTHTQFIVQANMLKLDPAKIAGPLETAFQDIVGQSFLLGVSFAIFSVTEHRI